MPRLLVALAFVFPLAAQQVQVEEFTLPNGLKFLLAPRKGSPTIAAGWMARVGSVNERPGITGLAHLFEHMMFKGTHTLGVKNIEEDLKLQVDLDGVKAELRKQEQELARRRRLGEISDGSDPKVRTARHRQLLEEWDKLNARQRELIIKEEYDQILTREGATGVNATTSHDHTLYFVNVPANKLELWFWLESDRLANPVFREFYAERDVVHEERRRMESRPTGRFQEQFDALFWQSSPYGWPVVGWPSDLEAISREDAGEFFNTYYSPNNLAACLVGDFDPVQVKALARRYFARLGRGRREPEPVRTLEEPQRAEQRMIAHAPTLPEAVIRYHTVAEGHRDEPALDVLASILSGRTGRFYKSLVLEQQLAASASARQDGLKYEGYFEIRGTARAGKTPEQVEQALYKEIERVQNEPVPARELEKVKNQFQAERYRRLQSDFFLMFQLLMYESTRSWQSINTDSARLEAVSVEDLMRVAKKYFAATNRNVLLFYTQRGAP
ncbi:MAG: insulinase family protein [Acidobacteria bacterium]|nr:insulinase family protein [Acidobacteriota bacterium]